VHKMMGWQDPSHNLTSIIDWPDWLIGPSGLLLVISEP
jgi:hypothetical protein